MKTSVVPRQRSDGFMTLLLGALLLAHTATVRAAEDRESITREDRKIAEAAGPWIYNDLEKGLELAKQTGKPLLVVFRCPP